jgi:hypothetical protein
MLLFMVCPLSKKQKPAFDKVESIVLLWFGIPISIGSLMLFFQFPEVYYFLGIFVTTLFLTTLTIILHRNKRMKKNLTIT